MTIREVVGTADQVLRSLKDFQRKTAELAFEKLFTAPDSTRRFLVADEVGLGKTLVAAGVIALAVDHLRASGVGRIDIVYMCSNQAIARQNVNRMKHRLDMDTEPLASRITLLPAQLGSLARPVNLIALTPGTSFNSGSSEGVARERAILHRMLTDTWGNLGGTARQVFRGGLNSDARFREHEEAIRTVQIDSGIQTRFQKEVGRRGETLHLEFERVRDLLMSRRDRQTAISQRRQLVAKLRRHLAHACLDALEPDLIILDEFQRFRDLLNPKTTSGELAKRLFEYRDGENQVRTLLLSATPYKMYTLDHENGDDHYRDFLKTVEFLEGPEGSVKPLARSLGHFRAELPFVAQDDEIGFAATNRIKEHRDAIQSNLRRVMSRTERSDDDAGGGPMLTAAKMHANLEPADVAAYLSARDVAAAAGAPDIMEYWKSTPYLLSFMERYKLAELVQSAVETNPTGEVAGLIRKSSGLQLRQRSATRGRAIAGGNGRMRAFLDDLGNSGLHRLLWLPPLLPGHELGRDFKRAQDASKRLLFSSWAMVPRAVSVLASYDVERRLMPASRRAGRRETRALPMNRRSYPLFAMLVPSATLAAAGDPFHYPHGDGRQLIDAVKERLRPLVADLTSNAPATGTPQPIWYAAIPLMMDFPTNSAERRQVDAMGWFQGPPRPKPTDATDGNGEPTAWESLVNNVDRGLANGAADISALGRPPSDLLEVMAKMAVASPANTTLRALARSTGMPLSDIELRREAMRAAWAFRSFFRSPTSEGIVRNLYRPSIAIGGTAYWRKVLSYSLEGGLSGTLDEFFHITKDSKGGEADAGDLANALCQVLELATGTLYVTEWQLGRNAVRRRTYPMGQHFARRYANDRASGYDPQADKHIDAVRDSFNSPFWPFVLSTTSVGQEGLDFHWYCHSVVHWNLPSNPVDLEQREGRVHRYHGHAIRKNVAQMVGNHALELVRNATARGEYLNQWDVAYRLADNEFGKDGGLIPHWVFPQGKARIQRYVPVLPLSRDAERLDALRRALAVYRMVFGQPRQKDLVDFILREVPESRQNGLASALVIDLRPDRSPNEIRI